METVQGPWSVAPLVESYDRGVRVSFLRTLSIVHYLKFHSFSFANKEKKITVGALREAWGRQQLLLLKLRRKHYTNLPPTLMEEFCTTPHM